MPHREPWGLTGNGAAVELITLTNPAGTAAAITTFGATLVRLSHRPRPASPPVDLVLGFDELAGYLSPQPYLGATIGRYANRIANGRFVLDGVAYDLTRNEGRHSLHGGAVGLDRAVWSVVEAREDAVTLCYVSPHGDQGFPGTLACTVRYELTGDDVLRMAYEATSDRATVVSLTNHAYFDLGGAASHTILDHRLAIDADAFLPITPDLIPTGEIRSVDGTPFDFRHPAVIGDRLTGAHADEQIRNARGFDHCCVLNGREGTLRRAAVLTHPGTGRRVEVHTTSPGLQLYTGNRLDGTVRGRGGIAYRRHHALCLEAQRFPDAPNQPGFPSAALEPGDRFTAVTEYRLFGDPP
ncbi:MAG: aldose epimerase family protein [Gemmatimonadales bacterium]